MDDDIKIAKLLETWYGYKKFSYVIHSDRIFNYAFNALLHLFIVHVLTDYDCEKYAMIVNLKTHPILIKTNKEHEKLLRKYKDLTFDSYMMYFETFDKPLIEIVGTIMRAQVRMQRTLQKNMGVYKEHEFINKYFDQLTNIANDIIKLLEKHDCKNDFDNLQKLTLKFLNYYITNVKKVFTLLQKNDTAKTALSYGKTLYMMTIPELKKMAVELKLKNYSKLTKVELVHMIEQAKTRA
jgi:hypothetical protein